MQIITLQFYQRVMLWNALGNYNAQNLKEASVFLRIMEKIRLTDEEQVETNFTIVGEQYRWKPMSNGYGTLNVQLEADEAKSLTTAIDAMTPIRVADAGWLQKVVEGLKTE